MRRLGWVLALALVGGGVAVADAPDRTFVEKAAAGGMAEVKLAKLAMDKGQAIEVKEFARKMLVDHNKANTELQQLAEKKNLSLPSTIDAKHQREYDKLVKLSGAGFDKEYMRAMTEDHDETVKLFKSQLQNGQDPELKSFAVKTLPIIEKHDDMAHMNEDSLTNMSLREK
jgi:putative membrane protein